MTNRSLLLLTLSLLLHSTKSSHVVSGTTSRLPMSLSTVINDLEAEGASYVTTAAFLSSASVRTARCAELLTSLFGIAASQDEGDVDIEFGVTTAFGKRLADEHEDSGGSGVAIACPSNTATVSEVCSTVVACGGTVVYVADAVDLSRGEGLFDSFAPAIERLLVSRAKAENEEGSLVKNRPSTLIVVFSQAANDKDVVEQRKLFETNASRMLSSIIQSGGKRATKLEDVFDRIEYLSCNEKDVDMHLCPAGGKVSHPHSPSARDPSEVAESVSNVIAAGLVENLGPMVEMAAKVPVKMAPTRLTSPIDLAAARLLGPVAKKALEDCLSTVCANTGRDGSTVVPEFGSLADAAIHRALSTYDSVAYGKDKSGRFKKSSVAKRIRNDLQENLFTELSDIYEAQVSSLQSSAFEGFKARLNKLRITPNLAYEMNEAAQASLKEFTIAAKKLRAKAALPSQSRWTSLNDQISDVKTKLMDYNVDRLKAARASGQFRPVPRKGVTVGFHWLLPKPFGNDFRQEPWMAHTADDLVYVPKDGLTDVSRGDIRSGDWRKGVVPAVSGSEMLYLK
ncbi:hypothetical protein ACHAWO_012097 [Cyclotella atomus]|uniref:Uncharacterized protein n=1 Tax=Cyclotella atomus TaxID=382360 RepID=A0ABD3NM13_9STRA